MSALLILKTVLVVVLLLLAIFCFSKGIIKLNPNTGRDVKKANTYIVLGATAFCAVILLAKIDIPREQSSNDSEGSYYQTYTPAPATAHPTPATQYPETAAPDPEPTSQIPQAASEKAKEGRASADAFMEKHYGDFDYELISANESNSDKYYYTYHVQALSYILSMEFDLPVDYEVSAGSCHVPGGGLDSWFSSTSPLWDDKTVRVWDLEGNWTYSDGSRDFNVTISNVNGEQFQMEYQIHDAGEEFISNGRESFELVPRMGNVEGYSSWYIQDASENNSDYDLSFIVYPFEPNPDGTVGVLAVEGYYLSLS